MSPITPEVARRKGNRLIILGDGQQVLPLVAVDDLIDGIQRSVRADRTSPITDRFE
jgi:hypothetical protein